MKAEPVVKTIKLLSLNGNKIRIEKLISRNTTHGLCKDKNGHKTRLYNIYRRMRQRCSDKNTDDYKIYGGRGILVCNEWRDYKNFYDWATNNGYAENLSIERADVNGNYEPNNCKWIPLKDQARNKRNNHKITFRGQTKVLAEWSDILGIESSLLRYRIKAWGVETAFVTPVKGAKT